MNARVACSRDGWFRYHAAPYTPFLVVADDPATHFIYVSGHPDTAELATLSAWLAPGDTCLDLGANVGFFSALLANRVGPSGRVIAVEAGPETFRNLCRTLSRLKLRQVIPWHACAGDRIGEVSFHIAIHPGDSVLQGVRPDENRPDSFRAVKVPIAPPDTLLADLSPDRPVALVKMDIEGSEIAALSGCTAILVADHPPLFDVEVNPAALARNGQKVADLLSFFPPERYELFFINCSNQPHPWPVNSLLPFPHNSSIGLPDLGNLIAVPRIGRFASRRVNLGTANPILTHP